MSHTPLSIPSTNLYLLVGDQRRGPFTLEQVRQKFQASEITRSTYLWYPGLLNWVAVGDVPEFDRRETESPKSSPAGDAAKKDSMWIYDKGQVVAASADEIREKIRDNKFRRGELVFEEKAGKWYRADQHPSLAKLFKPALQPPAPVMAPLVPLEENRETAGAKAPPLNSGIAPPLQIVFPAQAEAPRKFNWVYPGVGLAGVALLLVFATGVIDLQNLGGVEPVAEKPSAPRVPSSPAVPTGISKLQLMLPMGAGFEQLKANKDYKRCSLKNEHPSAGVTYRCFPLEGLMDSAEVTLKNGKVVKVVGWFGASSKAAELEKTKNAFGTSDGETQVRCEKLSDSQKTVHKAYCTAGAVLSLVSWTEGPTKAYLLAANVNGKSVPLEIWVETK